MIAGYGGGEMVILVPTGQEQAALPMGSERKFLVGESPIRIIIVGLLFVGPPDANSPEVTVRVVWFMMVTVAQLVEPWIVSPVAVGSTPTCHIYTIAPALRVRLP